MLSYESQGSLHMYVAKANHRVHTTKFTWNDGRDQIHN